MVPYSKEDLKLSRYDYELDDSFIADRPIEGRHHSKLLVYNAKTDDVIHTTFLDLPDYLPENSLLVLNESKVFPCRIFASKKTGGKAEIFVLSLRAHLNSYPCLIKTTSKKKIGDEYILPSGVKAKISSIGNNGVFYLEFSVSSLEQYLEKVALVPIPPYIRLGESDEKDKKDYQTLFAKNSGSVAAPTAGLHFTEDVFTKLQEKKIQKAFVTLHVGMGTFAPLKCENILEHKMHTEEFFIPSSELEKIKNAKKIFAVGTTSLRVLESSLDEEGKFSISPNEFHETTIFLHPGIEIKSVSGLVTNFHLPKSSLLILVSALIGRTKALCLYEEAKKKNYRFFSYGDAMLILR